MRPDGNVAAGAADASGPERAGVMAIPRPARTAVLVLLGVFAAAVIWNACTYSPFGGFDANANLEYAHAILDRWTLPAGTGSYYTPPGYYVLAAGAIRVGEWLDVHHPSRGGQWLNIPFTIGTALLLIQLARTIFPGRQRLLVAALGFFVVCPLVLKTTAMFHPEPLSMLLATSALLVAALMVTRASYGWRWALALGGLLGAGQLVRAFSLWTVAVVALTLAAIIVTNRSVRKPALGALVIALAVAAIVPAPWYIHQASRYSNPIFDRPQSSQFLLARRPVGFYLDPVIPTALGKPWRSHFRKRFYPIVYTETWGDYFGIWIWGSEKRGPLTGAKEARLIGQSIVGLPFTALGIAGWLALLVLSVRRLGERPERLLVALMPLAALLGLMYFAVSYPTTDGDTAKATYMLSAVPAWALCFGFAVDNIWGRRRWLDRLLLAGFAVGGLVCLAFGVLR